MTKAFDNFFWHDGNLQETSFQIDAKGNATVFLKGLFYKNENSPAREAYIIKATGVSDFNNALDVAELKNNMWAGNVSSGYLKDDTLWVYFTDGLLKIRAKKFTLSKIN